MSLQMNLIYQRAHYYARRTGQPLEDLVQEAVIGNLEADATFDPDRGCRPITWQWWSIERRLQAYCQQTRRTKYVDEPIDKRTAADPIDFAEFMQDAPRDVLLVCEMVLDAPADFAGQSPLDIRRALRDALLERGWSPQRAHEAIQDAKAWFRNVSPPLQRTKAPQPAMRRTKPVPIGAAA